MFEFAKNANEVSLIDRNIHNCRFKVNVSKDKNNFFKNFTITEADEIDKSKLNINSFGITDKTYDQLLTEGIVKIDFSSYGYVHGLMGKIRESNNIWASGANGDFSLFLIKDSSINISDKIIDVRKLICGETKFVNSRIDENGFIIFDLRKTSIPKKKIVLKTIRKIGSHNEF